MKIAVLGAGSWGTALAALVADGGHATRLWGRDAGAAGASSPRSARTGATCPAARCPPIAGGHRRPAAAAVAGREPGRAWRVPTASVRAVADARPPARARRAPSWSAPPRGSRRPTRLTLDRVLAEALPGRAGGAALGPDLRRGDRPRPAGRRGGRLARRRGRRAGAAGAGLGDLPRLHHRGRDRRGGGRRAQERHRHRRRLRRRPRLRQQRPRRADHPRAARDGPPGHAPGRQPADPGRAGGPRRSGADLHRRAVAQPPGRPGAGRGRAAAGHHRQPGPRRRGRLHRPHRRGAGPTSWASTCPSPRRWRRCWPASATAREAVADLLSRESGPERG